jgi:hypothetical protein
MNRHRENTRKRRYRGGDNGTALPAPAPAPVAQPAASLPPSSNIPTQPTEEEKGLLRRGWNALTGLFTPKANATQAGGRRRKHKASKKQRKHRKATKKHRKH